MSDILSKTAVTYFAQAAIGLFLFFILRYYAGVYKRHFLTVWSYCWLAAFLNFLTIAILTLSWNSGPEIRNTLSFVSTLAQLCHVLFLVIGSLELIGKSQVSSRTVVIWLVLIAAISVLITYPFALEDFAANSRYVLRVGFRTFATVTGFVVSGYLVVQSPLTKSGIGRKLIALCFVLYGAYHTYYIGIIIANVTGYVVPLPQIFGLVELVMLSILGSSMVIYLLEDEHHRLNKTNKELAQFLYRTSHDLRSPIATILSIVDLARKTATDPASAQYFTLIGDRVYKLDGVIRDIMNLTANQRKEVLYTNVEFNILIDEVFEELTVIPGKSAIDFRYIKDNGNFLVTDRAHLKIALQNIIENSVKYRDVHKLPYVEVLFQHNPNGNIITISDNGQGIPAESLDNVCDMFYRANVSTDGTGLGLYIAKEMIEKIKGTITVTSQFGVGSNVTITLPLMKFL